VPLRKVQLVTDQIYHVYQRSVDGKEIYNRKSDHEGMINRFKFYTKDRKGLSYSKYIRETDPKRKEQLLKLSDGGEKLVDVMGYCMMSNHFHLLVRQIKENGISEFVRNVTNSYAKGYNLQKGRKGPVYMGRFGAVRIENDNQLLHTWRYIELNPYTANLVKRIENLRTYPCCSLREYLSTSGSWVSRRIIGGMFGDRGQLWQFIRDQAGYQSTLGEINVPQLEGE